MATTIDHLRVDHRITVLRDFTDGAGVAVSAGERGIVRALSFDQRSMEIRMGIERPAGRLDLVFPLAAQIGPGNGRMRDYFELGAEVPAPGQSAEGEPAPHPAELPDGPDRLETVEQDMLKAIPHLGAAASIAEMYAKRMRAFRSAGDEPRAIAAFKLAMDWMGTYASWATSGGEGMALSSERNQFHADLVREFGYDPTARGG